MVLENSHGFGWPTDGLVIRTLGDAIQVNQKPL